MTKKKSIDTRDPLRVLLTDTLPYEVPLPFSNFYFHATMRKPWTELPHELQEDLRLTKKTFTIPYTYDVPLGSSRWRKLSVPHPSSQLALCDFYETYHDLILSHCSVSPFSIRYPSRVAEHYYEREGLSGRSNSDTEDHSVETEPAPFTAEAGVASSYFRYSRFGLLYKFFDSYEFLELERKFAHLLTLDISKCFYNIYSHTISWAVKSKEFAKGNSKADNFENQFDKVTQRANYNETHGILVGPEASRLFAEVILQRCDVSLHRDLTEKRLINESDYAIRRYLDDYFIFAKDPNTLITIHETLESHLAFYKLYLNTTKVSKLERPFISPLSVAKIQASDAVTRFFEKLQAPDTDQLPAFNVMERLKMAFLSALRAAALEPDVDLAALCKFCLIILVRKARQVYRRIPQMIEDGMPASKATQFHMHIYQILFYLYAMDDRVRTTFVLSRFILFCRKTFANLTPEVAQEADRIIFQAATRHLQERKFRYKEASVEALNLLIVLRELEADSGISKSMLCDVFDIPTKCLEDGSACSDLRLDYFQIVSIIYYVRDEPHYAALLEAVEHYVTRKFEDWETRGLIPKSCEATMLFLDLLACPWVHGECKKALSRSYIRGRSPTIMKPESINTRAGIVRRFASRRYWFFDWGTHAYISALLEKKELRSPY